MPHSLQVQLHEKPRPSLPLGSQTTKAVSWGAFIICGTQHKTQVQVLCTNSRKKAFSFLLWSFALPVAMFFYLHARLPQAGDPGRRSKQGLGRAWKVLATLGFWSEVLWVAVTAGSGHFGIEGSSGSPDANSSTCSLSHCTSKNTNQ